MRRAICFWVPGRPRPKGSTDTFSWVMLTCPRCRKRRRVNPKKPRVQTCCGTQPMATSHHTTKSRGTDWQATVAARARDAFFALGPTDGAAEVDMVFRMPRPKAHLNSKGELRPNAPTEHIKQPDADKLSRAIKDGLEGVAYLNDSQVVRDQGAKLFEELGRGPGVEITVTLRSQEWQEEA